MIVPTQFRSSPIRFLFYLNWLVLGFLFFLSGLPLWSLNPSSFTSWNWLSFIFLVAFALMGFKVSTLNQPIEKLTFLIGEILLIELTNLAGMYLYVFLYLVLIIRNFFIFSRSTRLTVMSVIFILITLGQVYRMQQDMGVFPLLEKESWKIFSAPVIIFSLMILFFLTILFLQLVSETILAEYRNKQKLAVANDKLRQYAIQIEEVAVLEERNRIAREIHDSLGHSLTVFNLHLEAVLKMLPSGVPSEAIELLTEAQQIGQASLNEIHNSVLTLRAKPLSGKSLSKVILELIEDLKMSTEIALQYSIDISSSISERCKIATYRILQEAITNLLKYSQATKVTITVATNTKLQLTVEDNGVGFILEQNTTGFGLQGMFERAESNGGHCQIITAPGQGCKILLSLPMD